MSWTASSTSPAAAPERGALSRQPTGPAAHRPGSPIGLDRIDSTKIVAPATDSAEGRSMPNWDPEEFENTMIADMRAHGGQVTQGPLAGHPLLVMTSTGAKTGQPRRAILTYTRANGDYVVAASAGGSPKDPVWLNNLRANPNVTIEADTKTFPATARIVDDADHDPLWAAHVAQLPHFAEYPKKAGRVIPVVRLKPQQSR